MYKYLKDAGNFNKMPSPFISVTQEEFLRVICHDKILEVEKRQIIQERNRCTQLLHTKIYYLSDRAYAIGQLNDNLHTHKYSYFRIGCAHTNPTVTKIGNCHTHWCCNDCGLETDLDSSD